MLVYDFKELSPFILGLLSKLALSFKELLFPGVLKILQKSCFFLHIELFNLSSVSLLSLICSFSSNGINFTLSISSLFLEISQLLDLSFFFISDPFFLHLVFILSLLFFLDVSKDGIIFFLLSLLLLLLHSKGHCVS